jgi:hypothetical protein
MKLLSKRANTGGILSKREAKNISSNSFFLIIKKIEKCYQKIQFIA